MELDLFHNFSKRIEKNIKLCFLVGMIIGIITHLYMLTNKLTNWDDVNSLNRFGAGDNIGRWLLKYVNPLGSTYSIPAVHGMIMIVFLSISACLIYHMLGLHSVTSAVLIPTVMLTFHSVACTMTFMFTVHSYGLAIFMLCLAVFIMRKNHWYDFFAGGALCVLAMGIYQSYISIAITLMLLTIVKDVLSEKLNKDIIFLGIKYIVTLAVSTVIYMKLCGIIYPNIGQETYAGVGQMGKIRLTEVPVMIARCYKRFLEFFILKPFAYMSKTMHVMNITICVCIGLLFVLIVIHKKIYVKYLSLIILSIAMFLIPFASAFVYFMAPDAPFSMLMLYAYCLIPVLLIFLWEKWIEIKDQDKNLTCYKMISFVICVCILISAYSNYLISNTAYMRMHISYERVYAYFNRIIETVELTDGYEKGDPVSILGEFYYVDNPSPVDIESFYMTDELREMSGVTLENGLVTSGVRDNFIENFIGFEMANIDFERKEELMNTSQYQDMPCYPQKGSIEKIEDVWVVKLCD